MPATILIVDDSEVVLEVARSVLEEAGYKVLTQSRANGSLNLIISEKPDLVLLDVNMPNLSGDVLARMCAKTAQITGTRVVFHSTLSEEHLQRLVGECGAYGYLRKSGIPSETLRHVRRLLKGAPREAASGRESVERESERRLQQAKRDSLSGVLLVDRDMETLSKMREIVRGLGHRSEFALSTRQATDKLRSANPPQVVVLSADMPEPGLSELLQSALSADSSWSSRFVFTTTGTQSGNIYPSFRAEIVRKPINEADLSNALRNLLPG
jgi:CheY-like chemotaxis protein